MVTESPPVSPRVVAVILMIQKPRVTAGTFVATSCKKFGLRVIWPANFLQMRGLDRRREDFYTNMRVAHRLFRTGNIKVGQCFGSQFTFWRSRRNAAKKWLRRFDPASGFAGSGPLHAPAQRRDTA